MEKMKKMKNENYNTVCVHIQTIIIKHIAKAYTESQVK